jgi:hypothetical protein
VKHDGRKGRAYAQAKACPLPETIAICGMANTVEGYRQMTAFFKGLMFMVKQSCPINGCRELSNLFKTDITYTKGLLVK